MQKKFIFLIFAILIVFTSVIFVGCGKNDMVVKENAVNIYELIEKGTFEDITLTIYYMNIFFLTDPVRLERLIGGWCDFNEEYIGGWYDYRTVVAGQDLTEHYGLIKQLFAMELPPTETESTLDARLYYVFEHKEYGEIFSVAAWGSGTGTVFVNGVEVKHNDIFYEAVLPFLPEDIAEDISDFMWGYRRIIETPPDILASVQEGNLDGISLMIFYTGSISGGNLHTEMVDSQDLAEHRDLIGRLFAAELSPSETESTLDARFHYVFWHEEHDEIFVFSSFPGSNLRANGVEVGHNDIFFEAVLPFLPEDIAAYIIEFLRGYRQE